MCANISPTCARMDAASPHPTRRNAATAASATWATNKELRPSVLVRSSIMFFSLVLKPPTRWRGILYVSVHVCAALHSHLPPICCSVDAVPTQIHPSIHLLYSLPPLRRLLTGFPVSSFQFITGSHGKTNKNIHPFTRTYGQFSITNPSHMHIF